MPTSPNSSDSRRRLLQTLRPPPIEAIRAEIERRRQARFRERLDEIRDACRTFRGFIREAWHVLEPTTPYVDCWHFGAIAEHLEAIHREEIRRLQLNQPPGTGKSIVTSAMFQAWEWGPGAAPGIRYLTTSYKEQYARRDSRKTRDLVQSEWYRALWPEVRLVRDNEVDFENNYRGTRLAVPFASLTAGRGNRLIIDDPHSVDTVESEAEREAVTRRFREAATSRLNDPERDAIIVIMHRLHPQDVCGIIEELGLDYVKLVLPMEYHKSLSVPTPYFEDPRMKELELLCPQRVSRETVETNKIELGEYAYQTQYQQQSRERAGTEFFLQDDLLVEGAPVEFPKTCLAVFAVIDSAAKIEETNNGTGVVFWAFENLSVARPLIALDWDYLQIEGDLLIEWIPTVFQRLEEFARICNARMGSLGAYIEDKSTGITLLQGARRLEYPVEAIDSKLTDLGKSGRAISVSGYVRKKQVAVSRQAFERVQPFQGRVANHFMKQVIGFRIAGGGEKGKDLLDCFTYGISLSLGNAEGF